MQSVPTVEPGEPMLRASRGSRALRIAPMLALLVGAGLFFSRPAEPPPSDIKLAIGKPFVQGIISLFDMKVDNILLQKPESQWSHFAVGMLAFDLLIDIHMELLFFGAQATLASAEIDLLFRGQRFGTLSTRPCPLGGGGKIKTQMAGQLVVDQLDVFQKIARAVVHEDEFTVELFSVVTVELRGTDNGCILRKDMCKTIGSARIPGVTFAKSVVLKGAQGFSVEMGALKLIDLPATEPAGKALISVDAKVTNPSSFELHDLDVFSIDIYTDDSWPKTERPAAESLGVKFAEVNTEAGFSLGKGESEWFAVQGFLSVPEREYDLVKTADVLNHFLTSRPTPLIASIAGSSQPFFSAAAKGAALRAFLPGMKHDFGGDTNIVVRAYIDLDVPVAVASLLNPLTGTTLHQYLYVALSNPFDATLYVCGLEAEVMFNGAHVGQVSLPQLTLEQAIVLPPSERGFLTPNAYPIELHATELPSLLQLLHDIAPQPAGKGVAYVDLNARIHARVGGAEPILVYRQVNVSAQLKQFSGLP
jgi:hypothetical protein